MPLATVFVIHGIPAEISILILSAAALVPFTFVFAFLSACINWRGYSAKKRAFVFLHGIMTVFVIVGIYLSSKRTEHIYESRKVGEKLDELRFLMDFYRDETGNHPSGTDAEILATLSKYSEIIQRSEERGFRTDENGRFRDTWGTPIRFVFAEGGVSVDSAGPDRRFDTRDDVTSQPEPTRRRSQAQSRRESIDFSDSKF
jgi:hypothetical protein